MGDQDEEEKKKKKETVNPPVDIYVKSIRVWRKMKEKKPR